MSNPSSEAEVLSYIEERQRGRTGIYPHHVAVDVATRFGVDLGVAREFVLHHILSEMGKGAKR